MGKLGANLLRVLRLEPVALGAALTAWATAQKWSDLTMAAVGLTIVWIVRMLSTPTVKVEEQKQEAHDAGYTKAVADIGSLADLSTNELRELRGKPAVAPPPISLPPTEPRRRVKDAPTIDDETGH